MDENNKFVVVKFINEDDTCNDEDDTVFEVGLTKWLKELDNMKTNISWPPRSAQSSALKKEMDASPSWPTYNVVVLKFYNTLLAARSGLNGFIMSSTYETDVEVGRGKRKKIERQHFSFDSPEKQITKKTSKIPSSDSSDSNPDDPGISQFANKTNVAAPPLVSYKPQNNKTESQRNITHGENIKTKILKKSQSTKNIMSTSRENKKSRKELLLAKINEAKKITPVENNRSEIIRAARKRQQTCDITKQFTLSSTSPQHDMSQKHKSTDVSSKFEMSPSTRCDIQKNVHSILQHSTPKKVQNVKKFKKNESFSVVSSEDDDILHPKKCTKPLKTANMSKQNITTSDAEFIEKSPSVSNVSHSQSDNEFSQSINAFSQIKESSTQSTPRSVRRSGNLSQILSEIRDFPKKTYIQTQEISSKLDIVIMNVTRLNRFLLPNEKRIVRPTDLPSLPITTDEELNKFETFLSENDNITGTICYMSQIIGSKDNIKEATYKVLKKLISNTLASEFNLKGGGNPSKKCFEKLTLYEVVEGAILSKKPQAELIEIAAATSSWLKQAPWRRQDDGTMGKRTK